MKSVQDWGFISKEQGLVKPKLQDNKIFHALTTAYENNSQSEIYGATENIVRREKELCEMALADLKKLSGGKSDQDGTLKLVMDHYQSRLTVAREKEEKVNNLSEDSRKMMEEYKKRTQELADVKRNLMESQSKLRELAKNTEKLLKKEEELRFIESNLRTELDKNKRNIINGLYEIVTDFSDQTADTDSNREEPITPKLAARPVEVSVPPKPAPAAPVIAKMEPPTAPSVLSPMGNLLNQPKMFTGSLFRNEETPAEKDQFRKDAPPVMSEGMWTRDKMMGTSPIQFSSQIFQQSQNPVGAKDGSLVEKAARLKMFEPGKSLVSKSMVKNQEGEVISEYFYSPLHPRDGRHYIFNSLYAVWSLLTLKAKDTDAFQERIDSVFTDLLSRLEHSQNIHLESYLADEINKDVISNFLTAPREERPGIFELMAARIIHRIESVGPGGANLIDQQFRQIPKP